MSLRILHTLYSFNAGGLENGLVNLINHLPEDQFSHVICVLSEGNSFLKRLHINVPFYELHKRTGNDFSLPLKIASIIRKENIDIVHTRNWVSLLEGAAGALIVGCRHFVHSEHGKEIEDIVDQPFRRHIARKACYAFSRKIISVSESLRDEMVAQHFCAADKVVSIVNGVDCDKFRVASKAEVLRCRSKYGIPKNAFVIGTVGRLAKIKNLECLLEIGASNKIRNQLFVLAGDGPERSHLQQQAQTKCLPNQCIFPGLVENVPEVLNTFDVFINTSHYEGVSNTLLEAMASGIPVVASRVGGTPEIIEDGFTGFLVESGDRDGFIEALVRLREEPTLREKMSQASRQTIQKKYSIEQMVQQYQAVYTSLCVLS